MATSNGARNGPATALGLLGVAFVVLRLCKVTDWSWWWVTAPFWGGAALAVAVIALAGALVATASGTWKRR